jgi:hypothetical protein
MIFKREPALWLGLLYVIIANASAFLFHWSPDTVGVIDAVAAALIGLLVAVITHDGISAAVLGFVKAVLALAISFGLGWSSDRQALFMSLVAAIAAMFVRTQATAPVRPVS